MGMDWLGEEDMVDVIQALLIRLGPAKHSCRMIVMLMKLADINDDNMVGKISKEIFIRHIRSIAVDKLRTDLCWVWFPFESVKTTGRTPGAARDFNLVQINYK